MASTDKIVLDLDTIERPADQKKAEFAFNWKGRRIVLTDPAELSYQELLEIEHPLGFIRYTASQEDRDHLAKEPMEGWRMGILIENYYKHFGLDDKNREKKLGF